MASATSQQRGQLDPRRVAGLPNNCQRGAVGIVTTRGHASAVGKQFTGGLLTFAQSSGRIFTVSRKTGKASAVCAKHERAKMNFFITGLPRSRTGWFANLFTTEKSFCHHDLTGYAGTMAKFQEMMQDGENVGDSDSGLLLHFDCLLKRFPEARWVVIWRDSLESFNSLGKSFPGLNRTGFSKLIQARNQITKWQSMTRDSRILVVTFLDLDAAEKIRKIWQHCLPNVPFNEKRFLLLNKLRVEPCQSKVDWSAPIWSA